MHAQCWICGQPANSREHKVKRSDLHRAFGEITSANDDTAVLHFVGRAKPHRLQGSNSKFLKYPPVICERCNTAESQPWDRAYERFINWIFENQRDVLRTRQIALLSVYGENAAPASSVNLYKYFVKSFGCRIASAGDRVPSDLKTLLRQGDFQTRLLLTFSVHKAVFAICPEFRNAQVGIGQMTNWYRRSLKTAECYTFFTVIGWLVIEFYYQMDIPDNRGVPWCGDGVLVEVGQIEGPSLDELIELARKSNAPALGTLEELRRQGGIRIE